MLHWNFRPGLFILIAVPMLHGAPQEKSRAPRIEFIELEGAEAPAQAPKLRWVATNDPTWTNGEPSFKIEGDPKVSARGWLAVSEQAILLKVEVRDQAHFNAKEKSDIWDGDCLQIGIDASGAASEKVQSSVSPTVASITAALTARGPELWAHYQGQYGTGRLREGKRHYPCAIVRDERAKTTTYSLAFPWGEFASLPGFAPLIGLCVQVNDSTPNEKQRRIYWGRGADGAPRPSLFERFAPGAPPGALRIATATRTTLWRPTDFGEIAVVAWGVDAFQLQARLGNLQKTWAPAKASGKGVRRFLVRATPGVLPAAALPFECRLLDSQKKAPVICASKLVFTAGVIAALERRIEALLEKSPHPLFTRHLRSIQALVGAEWNRALFLVDRVPGAPDGVVRDAQTILDGLNAEMGQWKSFAVDGRSLLFVREAWPDSTLQFATFSLPKAWDSNRAYPLIVDLHGAGPSHVLFYPAMRLQTRTNETNRSPDEKAYYRLEPWGRGNNGYDDWGKMDVFAALEEVLREFKVDSNRIYLTGHSMGGGAAWNFALRMPHLWAAVCPIAGGTWYTPLGVGLGMNASNLPMRIWQGEQDTVVRATHATNMLEELGRYGNRGELVLVPGWGHEYPSGDWTYSNTQWLLSHVRKLPERFSYATECDSFRGTRGIWMRRDLKGPAISRFDCTLEPESVRLTSQGASGLTVRLGENGLGFTNSVKVWWNGSNAYQGPPTEVKLGEGGGWYY